MSAHTPGPWEVSFESPRYVIQAPSPNGPGKVGVAVTAGLWDNAHNARLIASAPQLLEALQRALNVLHATGAMDEARLALEAIAAATGEK
jgi:hypothetical protein